jgi:hypothetical protein
MHRAEADRLAQLDEVTIVVKRLPHNILVATETRTIVVPQPAASISGCERHQLSRPRRRVALVESDAARLVRYARRSRRIKTWWKVRDFQSGRKNPGQRFHVRFTARSAPGQTNSLLQPSPRMECIPPADARWRGSRVSARSNFLPVSVWSKEDRNRINSCRET